MNSIIDAQLELKLQQDLEKERCKNPVYFAKHYLRYGNGDKINLSDYSLKLLELYESVRRSNAQIVIHSKRGGKRIGQAIIAGTAGGFGESNIKDIFYDPTGYKLKTKKL